MPEETERTETTTQESELTGGIEQGVELVGDGEVANPFEAKLNDGAVDADIIEVPDPDEAPTPEPEAEPEPETEPDGESDDGDGTTEGETTAASPDATGDDVPITEEMANEKPHLRKWRDEWKALKERAKELEARATQAPDQPDTPTVDPLTEDWFTEPPEQPKPQASADEIFDCLARAREEVPLSSGRSAQELVPVARQQMELLAPDEIHAVLRRARAGAFGELSDAVEEVASRALPDALYRAQQTQQTTARYERLRREHEEARRKVLATPGMNDPNSDMHRRYKAALKAVTEYVPPDVLKRLPRTPEMVLRVAQMLGDAGTTDQLAEVTKERDTLRAELEKIKGPLRSGAGGGTGVGGGKKLTAEQRLAMRLRGEEPPG